MLVTFHGHSCVQLQFGSHSIVIDPYLTENPVAVAKAEDVEASHVLITHGHSDHITDAVSIAMRNDAAIIAVEELAVHLAKQGARTEAMHVGGAWTFEFGTVHFVQATHASSVRTSDGSLAYAGVPVGFVIVTDEGTVYHAGDTGLYGDMQWLGERFDIDLALLPIGGRFTMGPEDALVAAERIRAKRVVPIHYDTFPPIRQNASAFVEALARKRIAGFALKPGETLKL